MKKIVQCELDAGGRQLTTWLEAVPKLREGVYVTLKDYSDPGLRWKVVAVHADGPDHFVGDFEFHRGWDNNNYDKHDGLKIKQ